MEQNYPRSAWYDQSLPTASAGTEKAQPKKPKKKRTGMKIAAISVCVVLLIAASVLAFSDSFRFDWHIQTPSGQYGSNEAPSGNGASESDDGGFAGDFRDFFSQYYSPVPTSAPDSNIERAEIKTDFRITLNTAEGLDALSLQALYSACAPAVVAVSASEMSNMSALHWGTGFIISSDGYIVTNQHIISGTDFATVILSDGMQYPAYLIGEDAQTDIAVLKIAAKDLPAVQFGDSGTLIVGDEVAAIGNPLGSTLTGTLTNGIISAIDRSIDYNGHDLPMLQTNTALNEGNSGGPLFNMYGQVVGITNMKMSAAYSDVPVEGIGFAIPSTTIKTVTDQLIATGKYSRPGLGITVGPIPSAVGRHYDLPLGLYISAVSAGSSAEEEGIQVGDILTHVNGSPVRQNSDVLAIRDTLSVGDEMTLTIFREGETFDVVIVLRELSQLY